MHPRLRLRFVTFLTAALASVAAVPLGAQEAELRHVVRSTPENVVWGWFPIDRAPVLTVRSGETVRIETLSHAGTTQAADPERYLGQFGVAPEDVLQDVLDFWGRGRSGPARGAAGT